MTSIQGSQVGLLWVPMRIAHSENLANVKQVLELPTKSTVAFPADVSEAYLTETFGKL
jgi:hypothetical protein